jgi:hypothetical protein
MPRYYLHLHNGHAFESDPDGMNLPDIEAARAEALRVCRELRDDIPELFENIVAFEIADATGRILLTFPCPELERDSGR